jgi:hypothetical protein
MPVKRGTRPGELFPDGFLVGYSSGIAWAIRVE